jgi:pyrroloquinoline quinone biosynthesis protein B
MIIKIVGSSAGGGFPQWNCNGPQCRAVRLGEPAFASRNQSSIAVSANGRDWALFNASPDIRQQIAATPALQPRPDGPLRHSPIKAVVVTNADVDHIAGLLCLREKEPLALYGAPAVLSTIAQNPIFDVLDTSLVARRQLALGEKTALEGPDGPLGLTIEAYAVPGKIPLYLEDAGRDPEEFLSETGDAIGLAISAGGDHLFHYIPGCAWVDDDLRARLKGAELVLFDGTLFNDSEMVDAGLGAKTGKRMGHLSISGANGTLERFADLAVGRRVFVHINNSNPILDESSKARRTVVDAGWDVGYDGMEITL